MSRNTEADFSIDEPAMQSSSFRPSRSRLMAISARTACLSFIATACVAASFSSAASAATNATSQPGWIYFPVGVQIINPNVSTRQGTVLPGGGCAFSNKGQGSGTASQFAEIESAVDPATCTAQWESGTLATSTDPAASSNTSTGSTSASGTLGTPPRTPRIPGTDPTAYQDNQWLDPFGIQTTAQEQWHNWTITSGCVTYDSWQDKWSWLEDGWNPQFTNTGYVGIDCNHAWTAPWSGFENSVFCAFNTTTNYFGWINNTPYGDYLTGFNNGTYSWSYNDSIGGGCTGLLHHGHIDHT